jgi:putative hydrolase of the HAD superfamily
VHEIDFSVLSPTASFARAFRRCRGGAMVYTNGSAPYAERVIEARGLAGLFDATYGVENAGYHPKPRREAFDTVFATDGLDPKRAAMFEDDPRNLHVPHALGMRTVHVAPQPPAREESGHIHHHTDDLGVSWRESEPRDRLPQCGMVPDGRCVTANINPHLTFSWRPG